MPKFQDLTGQRFQKLTVLSRSASTYGTMWLCKCDCEKEKIIAASSLTKKMTRSCGCLPRPKRVLNGKSRTREIWLGIIRRTKRGWFRDKDYKDRGIGMCDRWLSFENFLADMGEPPTTKHSIDRIDNNGNYEPSNCRWATQKQQSRNMRSNRRITIGDFTMCLVDWLNWLGRNYTTTKQRVDRGWTWEQALLTPPSQSPITENEISERIYGR